MKIEGFYTFVNFSILKFETVRSKILPQIDSAVLLTSFDHVGACTNYLSPIILKVGPLEFYHSGGYYQ